MLEKIMSATRWCPRLQYQRQRAVLFFQRTQGGSTIDAVTFVVVNINNENFAVAASGNANIGFRPAAPVSSDFGRVGSAPPSTAVAVFLTLVTHPRAGSDGEDVPAALLCIFQASLHGR